MVITLPTDLTAALSEQARRRGVAPEALALDVLRQRFPSVSADLEPRDEWSGACSDWPRTAACPYPTKP